MTYATPDPVPDGDPPAAGISPALLRASAAHPEQMADLVEALHRKVVDEDTLLDLMDAPRKKRSGCWRTRIGPGSRPNSRASRSPLRTPTIDSAIGVLMALHHLSVADATDLLHLQAANLGLPDHEAAAEILATTGNRRDPADPLE